MNNMRKTKYYAITAFIMAGLIFGFLYGNWNREDTKYTQFVKQESQLQDKENLPDQFNTVNLGNLHDRTSPKSYRVSQPIQTSDLMVTITKIEQKNTVGRGLGSEKPGSNHTFVGIQYILENKSNQRVPWSSFPDIQIKDEQNHTYIAKIDTNAHYAAEVNISNRQMAQDLEPGSKVKASEIFEIPQDIYQNKECFLLINGRYRVVIP